VLSFIDGMGAKRFVALARKLEAKHGKRFSPPQTLLDMAERGGSFYGRAEAKQAA
jgi:3-hydroxyacyl-CoA dehydrogenase/enoyl-CoA hydratase/3-hydroxybutyryl-CoA epimerase